MKTAEQVRAEIVSRVTGRAVVGTIHAEGVDPSGFDPGPYTTYELGSGGPVGLRHAAVNRIAQAAEDAGVYDKVILPDDYPTKEPHLVELNALSQGRYGRSFVELDVDQRNEIREDLDTKIYRPVKDAQSAPEESPVNEALDAFWLGFPNVLVYRAFKALEARVAKLEGGQ